MIQMATDSKHYGLIVDKKDTYEVLMINFKLETSIYTLPEIFSSFSTRIWNGKWSNINTHEIRQFNSLVLKDFKIGDLISINISIVPGSCGATFKLHKPTKKEYEIMNRICLKEGFTHLIRDIKLNDIGI